MAQEEEEFSKNIFKFPLSCTMFEFRVFKQCYQKSEGIPLILTFPWISNVNTDFGYKSNFLQIK